MKILIDSREQLPFAFSGKSFEDVTTEAGSLPTGDYSLAGLDAFAVVVEGSFEDLAQGRYRSKLNPHSACQSVLSFSARLGIPFLFAGNRAGAEYATAGFLRQYLKGCRERLKAIEKASQDGAERA